ncbi:hypothetical protein HG530_006589 [Fusarium avenaceum]|nr:hypothetical protein HG530_006589 [Fusarium avenaceum]
MAARDKFLLLHPLNLLPSKFIPSLLGRICVNVNQPLAGFLPDDPSEYYSSTSPFFTEAKSTSHLLGQNTTTTARILIDSILTVGRENANHPQANWRGEKSRVFNLPQEDKVLHNILNQPQLKKETEDLLDRYGQLYMITGFMTVINASCQIDQTNTAGVNFELPISTALEAAIVATAGVPISLPTISAEWQRRVDSSVQWAATYAGETIIAIRCRRLRRKGWILSGLLDGEIIMTKSNIRGTTMFGHDDEDHNKEEVEKWEDYMSNGLDADEEEDIVFSPSFDPEFREADGNTITSLGFY